MPSRACWSPCLPTILSCDILRPFWWLLAPLASLRYFHVSFCASFWCRLAPFLIVPGCSWLAPLLPLHYPKGTPTQAHWHHKPYAMLCYAMLCSLWGTCLVCPGGPAGPFPNCSWLFLAPQAPQAPFGPFLAKFDLIWPIWPPCSPCIFSILICYDML
jgi:hypothetical protein